MKTFELVNEKDKCCGCGLCAAKCPKNAIEMKEDEYGFVYPYINKSLCVDCGLCKKSCSYNNNIMNVNSDEKKSFVGCSSDSKILNTTASGGIFTSIATEFIKNDGIVFGCALEKDNNNFKVKHIKVESLDKLEKLKGSKYIQSDISNVYFEIKKALSDNKKVLFSGTPCQVAAIKAFTKNPDNLFTIDIICHGVPSNKMFNDYIKYECEKKNISIENFSFRDKSKGWGMFYSYEIKRNGKKVKKVKPALTSSYFYLFLKSYFYRESCYSCVYANDKRVGDITVGDYWGIESEHSDLIEKKVINPEFGASCIIINNEKGNDLLNNNKIIKKFDSDFRKIQKHNGQLKNPSKLPLERQKILDAYKKDGYLFIDKYYKSIDKIKKMMRRIWYSMPYFVRKILKKIKG